MALRRVAVLLAERQSSHWEVDESDLVVRPALEDQTKWEVYSPFGHQQEYLNRHALKDALFSTRARAVETIRLCLASEPLSSNQPLTQWEPCLAGAGRKEKLYLSKDGHWKLQVFPDYHQLVPYSSAAQTTNTAPEGAYSLRGATLRSCAFAADMLNRIHKLTA